VGDSFKIDRSQIPPIEERIKAEDERLEGLLGDVLYPVTFMDGDKVISTVMTGYGKEPSFPEYEGAAGWMDEEGNHWIEGYTKVKGATVLHPCRSATVGTMPTATDVASTDIVFWEGASPDDRIDLSVLDGQRGKEIVAAVGQSYTWDVVSSEQSYSGRSLNLGIRNLDMPGRAAEEFSDRVSAYLSFDQAGQDAGDAWVTYALPDCLKDERNVDMYEVGGGKPTFLRTLEADDGTIWWKYSGEDEVVLAGSEIPPAPEKKDDGSLYLMIAAVVIAVLIAAAAYAVVRRKRAKG
jgi:hypothetical protein